MAPVIRTNLGVARWIAIQTAFAAACVIPTTALAVFWMYGGDLGRTLGGYDSLRLFLEVALAEVAVVCPIVAFRSVSVLRDLNVARDELEKLAQTDQLTGLLNRRGFGEAAAQVFSGAGAQGEAAAALMCDIDYFKKINDEYGHDFGDAALERFAELLRSVANRGDIVLGRRGGEEFVALLPSCQPRDAVALAERLRKACAERPLEVKGEATPITVSIGVAASRKCHGGVDTLVALADAALYEAKRNGRNRVATAGDAFREAA